MRTAIFVAKQTTITIKPLSKLDAQALLMPVSSPGTTRSAAGSYVIDAGVYAIVSVDKLEVSGQNVEVQLTASDKDIFPDPPSTPASLGATSLQAVRDFFASITKGEDVSS